jgi:hypothetical protein
VIEVQIPPITHPAAVLAGVLVPFKNVMAGEFDLFARHSVEEGEKDHSWDPDAERDRLHAFGMRVLCGEVPPFFEGKRVESAIRTVENHLGVTFEQEGEGAADRTGVHRLPQAI